MSYHNYNNSKYAFLLGNGLNNMANRSIGWISILDEISQGIGIKYVQGFPLPSFFELLTLYAPDNLDHSLKDRFREKVKTISGSNRHRELFEFCEDNQIDILTTNFDHSLQKTNGLKKKSTRSLKKGFTDYYPWQIFYQKEGSKIKLFHINGDINYKRSIKLSVKDYAGNITRFNELYRPSATNSRYENDITWINTLFEKQLVILGLSLGEDEIFLRNLLIERKIYRTKNKIEEKEENNGYYLYCDKTFLNDKNKFERYKLFFNSVGIEMIGYSDYFMLYDRV